MEVNENISWHHSHSHLLWPQIGSKASPYLPWQLVFTLTTFLAGGGCEGWGEEKKHMLFWWTSKWKYKRWEIVTTPVKILRCQNSRPYTSKYKVFTFVKHIFFTGQLLSRWVVWLVNWLVCLSVIRKHTFLEAIIMTCTLRYLWVHLPPPVGLSSLRLSYIDIAK